MNTSDLANLYSELYPPEILRNSLDFVMKSMPEEVISTHPSIIIGNNGLTLKSLLLVSQNLLCELHLSGSDSEYHFDYVAKNTVFNYRIKRSHYEIKEEDVVKVSFELAEVSFTHGISTFITTLSFAGAAKDREEWLSAITEAVPVEYVLGYSRQQLLKTV